MAYPYDDPEQAALASYLMDQGRKGQANMTGRQAATMAGSMAPGMGLLDAFGMFPAGDQGFAPSMRQNIGQGEYFDTVMQMLGAGGDLAMATGIGAPVGMTMKSMAATGKGAKAAKKGKALAEFGAIKKPAKANMLPANRQKFGDVTPTVADPLRAAYPGIYGDPREIAAAAARNTIPESQSLMRLFGTSRDEMADIARSRAGNEAPITNFADRPKGSAAAEQVMTRPNTQRIVDTLAEAGKYPELATGMDAWYVMDPLFKRMEQLMGTDEAIKRFKELNTYSGMASPGSDVLTELNRGSAANYLAQQGRFQEFSDFAGMAEGKRKGNFPSDIRGVMSHPYHSTAQAGPMGKFNQSGEIQMDSPKVPLYIQSSGVPQTGFQTQLPVGDAHWSRGVGLADTRPKQMRKGQEVVPGASVSNTELQTLGDWWRKDIAGALGLESVPAQARAWGTFAPATGVATPVGAPKLELISQKIMQTAQQTGKSPEEVRDAYLMGTSWLSGRGLMGEF